MIFCVEDDNNIRDLLVYTLETTGFHARGLEDSQELWKALAEEEPELILLDIMLPGEDGYSILEKLKKSSGTRDIPIIMVTAKEAEFDKVRALEAGADDYITKPFGMMEFIARVKAVLRRTYGASEAVVELGPVSVDLETGVVRGNGPEKALTAKEYALLCKLNENRGRIVTIDALCTAAWHGENLGYENTLMVHMRRLREKIEPDPSHPRYLVTMRGLGYRLLKEARP